MCDEDDDEVMIFECGASLAANAFPNFEEIRRAGKLCDVVLVVGSVRFAEKICSSNFAYFLMCYRSFFIWNSVISGLVLTVLF